MKAHIFFTIIPKNSASNSLYLGSYDKKCTFFSGIPILIFLCIFKPFQHLGVAETKIARSSWPLHAALCWIPPSHMTTHKGMVMWQQIIANGEQVAVFKVVYLMDGHATKRDSTQRWIKRSRWPCKLHSCNFKTVKRYPLSWFLKMSPICKVYMLLSFSHERYTFTYSQNKWNVRRTRE